METFNLIASNIKNLELKLKGELPINRDELLILVNTWGRNENFYTDDKNGNQIKIEKCIENKKYDLSKLDVSEITNFNDIFTYSNFNGDINSWDVSNATSMTRMFSNSYFNSPLDKWNTSKVINIKEMFYRAEEFNQNLNSWDISKVTSIKAIFYGTENFNQPLDKWDVSKVESMDYMFSYTKKFNQDLNSWNISKVKDMNYIFAYSEVFNQPILWDVSNIKSGYDMFYNAKSFLNKFNKDEILPNNTMGIKDWLKENQNKMIAIDIEHSKGEELDQFLSNINVITSTKLNGLHNNKK